MRFVRTLHTSGKDGGGSDHNKTFHAHRHAGMCAAGHFVCSRLCQQHMLEGCGCVIIGHFANLLKSRHEVQLDRTGTKRSMATPWHTFRGYKAISQKVLVCTIL